MTADSSDQNILTVGMTADSSDQSIASMTDRQFRHAAADGGATELLGAGAGDGDTMASSRSLWDTQREQRGVFKLELSPILNNFAFKIFFFVVATSLVFFVSVVTAFVVMRIVEYLTALVQVSWAVETIDNTGIAVRLL